ncbi:hypothetical protein [Burkholderia sp. Tr-20390]|uniref:hypothetical protein n=1 Tax=Burkholderia sp. Tr-20390 TaxID=2703904 RepID=UPI001F121686|nr:hypothetical protein [Burkholderia sp. Tr-20390]MBN3733159.1 hypothetical protein [Burkholderia sp. Tr-20390]
MLAGAGHANASDYGCTVLLCLANPSSNGGPMGVAECVAPITKLFDDLAHFRPFPTCDMADGNDGSSYAKQVTAPYDPCPSPLKAAPAGTWVVEGKKASSRPTWFVPTERDYTLAGAPQITEQQSLPGMNFTTGPQACIGNKIGYYVAGSQMNGDEHSVNVYDRVIWQKYQSPRAIDVYIDNQFNQRVHW